MALVMLPWLPSCVETTPDVSCIAFRQITLEDEDVLTKSTARQILGHNHAFAAICQ